MSQEDVLSVIKKYPKGALFKDISIECNNPGTSIRYLYKHKIIDRKIEGRNFRYFIRNVSN